MNEEPDENKLEIIQSVRSKLIHQYLKKGKKFSFRVFGVSMLPSIPSGSVITITKIEEDKLKIGDILVVEIQNKYLVHRLIFIGRDAFNEPVFQTKGDNAVSKDKPVGKNNILGKIISVKYGNFNYRVDSLYGKFTGKILTIFSRHNSFTLRIYHGVVRRVRKMLKLVS